MSPKVDAQSSGSFLIDFTFLTSPYKVFKNDSNGHGCYFKKIIILIFE
jgi:hypothetical protein